MKTAGRFFVVAGVRIFVAAECTYRIFRIEVEDSMKLHGFVDEKLNM